MAKNYVDIPVKVNVDPQLKAELTEAIKENKLLRYLLWLRHATDKCALYGDDGEMQCNSCMIDFKGDHPNRISERFMIANGTYTQDQIDAIKERGNQKCINCFHGGALDCWYTRHRNADRNAVNNCVDFRKIEESDE